MRNLQRQKDGRHDSDSGEKAKKGYREEAESDSIREKEVKVFENRSSKKSWPTDTYQDQ